MRKKPIQPYECPSNCWSHSSLLANQRCTTRTTHVPPPRASTIHSVATFNGPSSDSATKLWGGFQVLMVATDSIPGPKLYVAVPPARSSTVLGTNHDEMPFPVAIARQTSSGEPGTSTSAWTDR